MPPFCCSSPAIAICFPPGTLVTSRTRGEIEIQELTRGEEILTLDAKNGAPKWTEFYTWTHKDANIMADFVVLIVSDGKELLISNDHQLFVAGEQGKLPIAKKAGDVKIGEELLLADPDSGHVKRMEVVEISVTELRGVYAPLTMSGTFLANGILVGCYLGGAHKEAHLSAAPLRAWYRLKRRGGGGIKQDKKDPSEGRWSFLHRPVMAN